MTKPENQISWEEYQKKTIVGLTENVTIRGNKADRVVLAKIDTGATKSSIDISLASKLELGPVVDSKIVKSAHGEKLRPVVRVGIVIRNKSISAKFTLADRTKMKYSVLIGQNILKKDFLIDPNARADPVQDEEK
jgi:hypothetical protein